MEMIQILISHLRWKQSHPFISNPVFTVHVNYFLWNTIICPIHESEHSYLKQDFINDSYDESCVFFPYPLPCLVLHVTSLLHVRSNTVKQYWNILVHAEADLPGFRTVVEFYCTVICLFCLLNWTGVVYRLYSPQCVHVVTPSLRPPSHTPGADHMYTSSGFLPRLVMLGVKARTQLKVRMCVNQWHHQMVPCHVFLPWQEALTSNETHCICTC